MRLCLLCALAMARAPPRTPCPLVKCEDWIATPHRSRWTGRFAVLWRPPARSPTRCRASAGSSRRTRSTRSTCTTTSGRTRARRATCARSSDTDGRGRRDARAARCAWTWCRPAFRCQWHGVERAWISFEKAARRRASSTRSSSRRAPTSGSRRRSTASPTGGTGTRAGARPELPRAHREPRRLGRPRARHAERGARVGIRGLGPALAVRLGIDEFAFRGRRATASILAEGRAQALQAVRSRARRPARHPAVRVAVHRARARAPAAPAFRCGPEGGCETRRSCTTTR